MSFKLQVVQHVEEHGKRPACNKFNANKQCITEWSKQKERLENALKVSTYSVVSKAPSNKLEMNSVLMSWT